MAKVQGGGIRENGWAQHSVQHRSFESSVFPLVLSCSLDLGEGREVLFEDLYNEYVGLSSRPGGQLAPGKNSQQLLSYSLMRLTSDLKPCS